MISSYYAALKEGPLFHEALFHRTALPRQCKLSGFS
jgi:hypothetical protein